MGEVAWKSPSIPWIECTPEQRKLLEHVYREGDLAWKLTPSQKQANDKIDRWVTASADQPWMIYAIDSGRKWGKSGLLFNRALSNGFKNKAWRILYISPILDETLEIVRPLAEILLQDCPPHMRPKWLKSDKTWEFHNGSVIRIVGLDVNPDSARGPRADMIYLDEAGFFKNLGYLINSILAAQMLPCPHARIIAASTPPTTPMHEWSTEIIPRAIKHDAHDKKTLRDADQYTDKRIQQFYDQMPGGASGVSARREYDAEHIADDTLMILPEFRDGEKDVVKEWTAPTWRDCYVSMDPGYHDLTGILFGYWDFYEKKLVIEDNEAATRQNSYKIAQVIRKTEERLWKGVTRRGQGNAEGVREQPFIRISPDDDLRLIADLKHDYDLSFIASKRDNLIQQVDAVRVAIQRADIVIHPRCTKLIKQCKSGVWRKGRIGKDFDREPGQDGMEAFGHYDLIAALIYMWRNIHKSRNPEPRMQQYIAGDLKTKHQPSHSPNSRFYREGGRFFVHTGRR